MAGETLNAGYWPDADVYISDNLNATIPSTASTAFGADWDLCGLLDGDDGFVHTRNEDTDDKYAWGGILVRTTRAHFKETVTFSLLEDNDATRSLIWPGSSGGSLVVPKPAKVLLALETRETSTSKIRRLITANYAEITVNGDITENETDITKFQMLATIFPDASEDPAVLWTEQRSYIASA